MHNLKNKRSLKFSLLTGSCVLALSCFATPVTAQVENATGIADPSRASGTLFADDNIPDLSESVSVSEKNVQNAPDGADKIQLKLNDIRIEGVSAYNADELDPVYRSYLGQTVSLADVYGIANDLTRKYRNDGYILTQVYVPPQTIDGGTVRLSVVEGFVDQVIIEGDLSAHEEKQIRAYADGLREGGILDAAQMERYLLLINDLPGVKARAVLGRSASVTGAADLTLIVERDVYDAEIEIDNYGSRYLGPYQASYNGNLNSVFGLNERITTQLAIGGDSDNEDELLYGALAYEMPISKYGTTVTFNASKTHTDPGFDLAQFDVQGYSHFYSAKVQHPFIRSRTTNLYGRAVFDMRDVDSKNNLETFTRKDRIRSLRLGATLQFMDTFLGLGLNAFDVQYSQGVEIFGTTQKSSTIKTRNDADPQYKKIEFYGQRLQRINSNMNLLLAGSGQWSANPLFSSEEFGVGGIEFGRGYDSSEIVGDNGIAGKAELRWNTPKPVQYINNYQLYTFFDIGRVWDEGSTTDRRDSLASTGLGVRANITDKLHAGVGVAFPLTRERDTTNDRDPRYYFNISHKF